MSLAPGTRLGVYDIVALIGAGGMGEVYRGRDTRLDRTVAIKVLPTEFSGDSESRARFDREARAIAALNHPHICVLHDVGCQDGLDFLVMEHLDGETLAKRLEKGPLPWETAVLYAAQIADALDRAHRHGIVHRDLKPGNVMVTRSGVKLLDFGLAKASPATTGAAPTALSSLPTTPHAGTASGVILGTFQYMAPEQLEGGEADARTDIFALGCVLYEMLTGRRPFDGRSQASLIAAILQTDPPPPSSAQPSVPPPLDRIVSTCLAKDPEERWQSARDVARELRWIGRNHAEAKTSSTPSAGSSIARRWQIAAAVMGIAALASAAVAYRSLSRTPAQDREVIRFSLPPPENVGFSTAQVGRFAISPNGRYLAFVGAIGGKTSVWLRPLDSLVARTVPGTEGADFYPFWSPDSRNIGFYAGGRLKRVGIDGSGMQTLCQVASVPEGGVALIIRGTWNDDGAIVFARGGQEPLFKVNAAGGACEPVTRLNVGQSEWSHSTPQFLADGEHFVFVVRSMKPEHTGIYVGSVQGGAHRQIIQGATNVAYTPDKRLIYVRERELVVHRFDERTFTLVGSPLPIGENVEFMERQAGTSHYSVSANGTLVYAPGGQGDSRLTWFDRSGRRLGVIGDARGYGNFELDGTDSRVAVSISDLATGLGRIWSIDLTRAVATQLTFAEGRDNSPVWSPDGQRIAFTRAQAGMNTVISLSLANGRETRLHEERVGGGGQLDDWSPDGKYITFNASPLLRAIPASGGAPFTFVETATAGLDESHFSPDGKWIVYNSTESGTWQVYIAPFPTTGERWQISQNGGAQARWKGDGRELFYLTLDGRMMAVNVTAGDGRFRAGVPRELFQTDLGVNPRQDQYAVTRDGQRFLIASPVVERARHPLTVVLNWTNSLKQ